MIHPTAVIDPRAELAADVRVGPYSVIGPDVTIGAGAEIGAHVVLEGRVRVGARGRVGHGAIIGGVPQDLKFREGTPVGVSLGDDTVVREYVTIHRATHEGHDTTVGRHCLVMASSHVAHDCVVGEGAHATGVQGDWIAGIQGDRGIQLPKLLVKLAPLPCVDGRDQPFLDLDCRISHQPG